MARFAFIKTRLDSFIRLLPYGRDLYLSLLAPRRGLSYSKAFDCYDQAFAYVERLPKYDEAFNKVKSERLASGEEELDSRFFLEDYAVLFWLHQILASQKSTEIYELGGSLGNFFYSSECLVEWPRDIKWCIAELPEAVKVGKALAGKRNEQRLVFLESSATVADFSPSVFLSAGTLQYVPRKLTDIVQGFNALPKHILLHRQPVTHAESFWTIQNLGKTKVPYFIQNEGEFDRCLEALGYIKVVDWKENRSAELPWHRSKTAHAYKGGYFRLKESAEGGAVNE